MKCPLCYKELGSREFYDHMSEYHCWSMAEGEKFLDDLWLEQHGGIDPFEEGYHAKVSGEDDI